MYQVNYKYNWKTKKINSQKKILISNLFFNNMNQKKNLLLKKNLIFEMIWKFEYFKTVQKMCC